VTVFDSPARGEEEVGDPVAPQACSELGECLRLQPPAGVEDAGLDAGADTG
jgi:hypothetical protein